MFLESKMKMVITPYFAKSVLSISIFSTIISVFDCAILVNTKSINVKEAASVANFISDEKEKYLPKIIITISVRIKYEMVINNRIVSKLNSLKKISVATIKTNEAISENTIGLNLFSNVAMASNDC